MADFVPREIPNQDELKSVIQSCETMIRYIDDAEFVKVEDAAWAVYAHLANELNTDPPVFTIYQSDIEAVEVHQAGNGEIWADNNNSGSFWDGPDRARYHAMLFLRKALREEAVAWFIEKRDKVTLEEKIEARAKELFDLAYPPSEDYALTGSYETCRRIATAELTKENTDA